MTKSGFTKLLIVLLAIVISISAVPMAVVAYHQPEPGYEYPYDHKWTYSDCWYAEAVDRASFGHVWLGGKWVWDWRTSCPVETRHSEGSNYNRITATGVEIYETYNGEHMSIFTSTDPNMR